MNTEDIKFLRSMIPHHQMAIQMAGKVLKEGEDSAVKILAQGILDGQSKEIDQMRQMLNTTNAANKKDKLARYAESLKKMKEEKGNKKI